MSYSFLMHALVRRRNAVPILLFAAALVCLMPASISFAQERSLASETAVTVIIQNSTAAPVEMIWIDFAGLEKSYGVIPPGESRELGTYATHVWRFKQNGQILGAYVVGRALQQFYNILTTKAKTLGTSDFVCDVQDPRIKFDSRGFVLPYRHLSVWSKEEVYGLVHAPEFSLEFDAQFTNPKQQMIIAFSHNKLPWGQPGADALTVRVSPGDQDFWFRTGFYENWLEADLYYGESEEVVLLKQWQHFEIQLTRNNVFVFVEDDTIAAASLEKATFPRTGFVGFIVYGDPEIEQTMISYQNIVLHGIPGAQAAVAALQLAPVPEDRPPAESASRNIRPAGNTNTNTNTNTSLSSPGRYYALVIGVQEYIDDSLTDLDYPIQDAQNVITTLTSNYTFAPENLTFLKNPTKNQITDAFDQLVEKATAEDNLLIFFAGHGYWDERLQQGFWMPADAKKGFRSNWLSNGTVRDYIQGLKTKHTLLITDACFSGGIFKTRAAFSGADRATEELYKTPSRKAMTSGALKEVPDKSVFISYLIKRLQENSEAFLPAQKLFTSLREPVINNSPNSQVPQFGVIREAGDEDGEFIFVRKK